MKHPMRIMKYLFLIAVFPLVCLSCSNKAGNSKKENTHITMANAPVFNADSAYSFVDEQCKFGPRIPNSLAHRQCGDYLVNKFKSYGATVTEQKTDVRAFDGTVLHARNIIASFQPQSEVRFLVCGHWDSRPWADNDLNPRNWKEPVMGANDGGSGVAVMLELARAFQQQPLNIGIDLICFDAEDYGVPQWEDRFDETSSSWCLGSQYWASYPHQYGYRARYGILLDMVGGMGCTFSKEGYSLHYAPQIVDLVWKTAHQLGYGQYFPYRNGGYITDDHVPVNETLRVPCINIVPYFTDGPSNFGPTWHTIKDDINHIDKNVLKAVGQTVLQVIYNENI